MAEDEPYGIIPRRSTGGDIPELPSASHGGSKKIRPLLALMVVVNLAGSLYQLPVNRVVERRLCREYYARLDPSVFSSDMDEGLCKVDEVQQGLAWIQGVAETGWIVGDFVMTIPLGFVAEKYGRRAVLFLNLVPRVSMLAWAVVVGHFERALPTRAIVASPFLSVLGGDCVFNSLAYALAAGLTDDHALRASYFGYMSSVSYVVALLGPALASATMSLVLWLPLCIGIALLFLAVPLISRLPDGHSRSAIGASEEQSQPLISSPVLKAAGSSQPLLRSIAARFETLQSIITSHPWNFTLLLMCMFLTSLASSDTKLLLQYISKRFGWTFASVGYLLSAKAVVNFTLLAVVIPRALHRRRSAEPDAESADQANVRFAHVCLFISVIGALAIASAATLWLLFPALLIYALGSALPVFTLSLLKSRSISPPGDQSSETETHVFSIVMLVKTLGSLLGAPLMAALWFRGISLGGSALGMPYFISAACYLAAAGVLSAVRVG